MNSKQGEEIEKHESMFMAMAYPTKKANFGPKIQQWQDEMNREFTGTLLSTPLIRTEGTRILQSRNVSNGQIILEKIKIGIQHGRRVKKSLEIYVERFNAGDGDHCTWPECMMIREPTDDARDSLYLCEFHRKRMENDLTKMCAANGVAINPRYSYGDFKGYNALMELFESALRKASDDYEQGRTEEGKMLQDIFLNVRNFLIIVSALIKPDEELLSSFLPHIMGVALDIVKLYHQHPITNLASFMQHLTEYILFFFGIMSPWESLFPDGGPYRQIGMGIGGLVGVFGLFVVSPPHALAVMGVGGLLGAAIGNTLYISKKRREMLDASYCRYLIFRHTQQIYQDDELPKDLLFLSGSAYGDTLLMVILIVQALVILMAL